MRRNSLISIESQTEYSVTSGHRETRFFIKMYSDAAKCGLIGDLGLERWGTLCVIASFMNEGGECYPTQSQIADCLGVSRQTANKYVNSLLDYRWEGRPIIRAVKSREGGGKWVNTRYTVLPISQLTAFESVAEKLRE